MHIQALRILGTLLLAGTGTTALAQQPTLRVLSVSAEQNNLYRQLEKAFHERYPQWTVRFETVSVDAFNRTLPLSFQSGDAPDLILNFLPYSLDELLANKWIAPISGNKPVPTAFLRQFPKNAFVEGWNVRGGKVYGVPLTENDVFGPGYLYYNRAVLRKAGLNPDSSVPKTWKQLLDVCAKVKASGNACFTASFQNRTQFQRWWQPFTGVAQSQSIFNYATGKFAHADKDRLRAWTLLKTLYDNKYFIPGVETVTREASRQVFGLNQAAFYVDGSWMPTVWRTGMGFKNLDFGVAPVPVPDSGTRGKLTKGLLPPNLFVTSQARNKDAAWALVRWLTDPNGTYAKGYVGADFGYLSFANNSRLANPDDKVLLNVLNLGKKLRATEPVPLLACKDMAKSTAYRDAETTSSLPTEEDSIVEALIKGQDWVPVAQRMARERQKVFEAKLKEEQAEGLKVDIKYFTYPNYRFGSNFDLGNYPLCR